MRKIFSSLLCLCLLSLCFVSCQDDGNDDADGNFSGTAKELLGKWCCVRVDYLLNGEVVHSTEINDGSGYIFYSNGALLYTSDLSSPEYYEFNLDMNHYVYDASAKVIMRENYSNMWVIDLSEEWLIWTNIAYKFYSLPSSEASKYVDLDNEHLAQKVNGLDIYTVDKGFSGYYHRGDDIVFVYSDTLTDADGKKTTVWYDEYYNCYQKVE